MKTATKSKRGRKAKHYIGPDGKQVYGLGYDERSKRWRIIGKNQWFSESDPQKAIEHFRKLTGAKPTEEEIVQQGWLYDATDDEQRAIYGPSGILSRGAWRATKRLWLYVADQMRRRPKWCAEQAELEQFGYLLDLKPPEKLPSLDALESEWKRHAKCSGDQIKKVLRAWRDFRTTTKISDLRDITAETVVAYSDDVVKRGLSGKQQHHLYSGIRRLLRFAKSRALAIHVIAERLDYLELLHGDKGATTLDPKPIEREDWDKLIAVAQGDDKAMLYLMLNCALYVKEVIKIRWEDIRNGCLITHRNKTGKCIRVAVLWQETIDALNAMKKQGEYLFYTYAGLPIKASGAQRRWQRLALKAGLAVERMGACKKRVVKCDVTASQLRDGAATAAAEANTNQQLISLLLGHRSGIGDHYVKRNPKMVSPATDAVYRHYFRAIEKAAAAA